MSEKTCVAKTSGKGVIDKFEKSAPLAVRLSPPWLGWSNEVKAIFSEDDEIKVADLEEINGRDGYVLAIDAKTVDKANALRVLLPFVKTFGNINVAIEISLNGTPIDFVSDKMFIPDAIKWVNKLFKGGAAVEGQYYEMFGGYVGFVVCPAEIVQFYNDDISDVNGNKTMLFANAARDVLEVPTGINFCTESIR